MTLGASWIGRLIRSSPYLWCLLWLWRMVPKGCDALVIDTECWFLLLGGTTLLGLCGEVTAHGSCSSGDISDECSTQLFMAMAVSIPVMHLLLPASLSPVPPSCFLMSHSQEATHTQLPFAAERTVLHKSLRACWGCPVGSCLRSTNMQHVCGRTILLSSSFYPSCHKSGESCLWAHLPYTLRSILLFFFHWCRIDWNGWHFHPHHPVTWEDLKMPTYLFWLQSLSLSARG